MPSWNHSLIERRRPGAKGEIPGALMAMAANLFFERATRSIVL